MASDNFNTGDAGTLGSNWTATDNPMRINTQRAEPSVHGAWNAEYYSAATWGNDQTSQADFLPSGDVQMILTVRHQSGAAGNFYALFLNPIPGDRHYDLYKRLSGSFTLIDQFSINPPNHTYKMEVVGTTLRCYDAGVPIFADHTDSSITSGGAAGLGGFLQGGYWDNWVGTGDGSAPAGVSAKAMVVQRAAVRRASYH